MKKFLSLAILFLAFGAAAALPPVVRNPFSTNSNNELTRSAFFVSAATGSDSNSGDVGSPWATIGKANTNATTGSTIYVASGTYLEPLRRGGVVWVLARGCVIDADFNVCVSPFGAGLRTNFTVLGNGVLKSTGNVIASSSFGDGSGSADMLIEADTIVGGLELSYNLSATDDPFRFVLRRAFVSGSVSISDGFGGANLSPDLQFQEVNLWTNLITADVPYLVRSGASKVSQSADTFEVGSWLVHTNMQYPTLP